MTSNKKAAPQASNQREIASKSRNNNNSSPIKHKKQTRKSEKMRRKAFLKSLRDAEQIIFDFTNPEVADDKPQD